MDWLDNLQKAINYIEEHLLEDEMITDMNISHEIYNLAIKVSNKIITSNINYSICDNCAKLTNVSGNLAKCFGSKLFIPSLIFLFLA